jgi:hypothetical protein
MPTMMTLINDADAITQSTELFIMEYSAVCSVVEDHEGCAFRGGHGCAQPGAQGVVEDFAKRPPRTVHGIPNRLKQVIV